jgi:hypothetical protein
MTNEEKMIRSHIKNENPFKVPDGYFDSLSSQIISQLPEKSVAKAKTRSILPMFYAAAACLLIAVLSFEILWERSSDTSSSSVVAEQVVSDDVYYENVADYVMVDNYEIYACLVNE